MNRHAIRVVERQAEADHALVFRTHRQLNAVARALHSRAMRCHSDEARQAIQLAIEQIVEVAWPSYGEIEGELLRDLPATLADERREAAI